MSTSVKCDLIRDRLRNQKLIRSTLREPGDVVAWLGAVQAQDFTGAKWALGARGSGMTDAAVEQAFDAGRILRTHILRPTWHFVSPADIRWMLTLSAPRVHAANGSSYRKYELDDRVLSRNRRALERALEGGKYLTRAEIAAVLARAGIVARGIRLAYLVIHAELNQVICSGPTRGKQFTYALLDERAPRAPRLDADESLARLTQRYFTSHGPATLRDYVWWSGLTVRQGRTGIEMVKSALEEEVIDGRTYWFAPTTARRASAATTAWLLPNYDEYLIAYKDRGEVVDGTLAKRWGTNGTDPYAHPLVIDGRFTGVWRRGLAKGRAKVDVTPYRKLTRTERDALDAEVARYGRFMNAPADLTLL